MGKAIYDVVRGFDMEYPYIAYKNYVFSKSATGSDKYATFIDEDIKTFIMGL
ncbi:hypothetical protein V5E38_06915 [Rossellomorea sp. GAMAL-10_SWC]